MPGAPWTLGLWVNEGCSGRYIIEHWVRVDHLPFEDQRPWFRFRLDWIKAQIVEHSELLVECTRIGDKVNRKLREEDLARDWHEATYAQTQLRAFTEHTGFHIPDEDL